MREREYFSKEMCNLISKGLKHLNTVLISQKAFDISTNTTALYHCLLPLHSPTGLKHFTKLLHLNNHKQGHLECYCKFIKQNYFKYLT